jgi:hypothetical protein
MNVVRYTDVVLAYSTWLQAEARRIHLETFSDGETDTQQQKRTEARYVLETLQLHYLAQAAGGIENVINH